MTMGIPGGGGLMVTFILRAVTAAADALDSMAPISSVSRRSIHVQILGAADETKAAGEGSRGDVLPRRAVQRHATALT